MCLLFVGDRQRDSSLLLGDNSATRRTRSAAVQQGPPHPEDGLVYPGTFPECQIYIHGARRTRHGAFHHIQKGNNIVDQIIFYVILAQRYCQPRQSPSRPLLCAEFPFNVTKCPKRNGSIEFKR